MSDGTILFKMGKIEVIKTLNVYLENNGIWGRIWKFYMVSTFENIVKMHQLSFPPSDLACYMYNNYSNQFLQKGFVFNWMRDGVM